MKYLITLIFVVVLVSCNEKNEIKLFTEEITGKKVELVKIDSIKISEDSTSFIGKFLDVKYRNNSIVIADITQPAIFFYNNRGKLIKHLKWRTGEGPDEILRIGNFEIIDGKIYISDIGNFRWAIFDTNGVLIKVGRPFSDPREKNNQLIYENGSIIEHFGNEIFTAIIEAKYNRDLYQHKSKSIAKLDTNLTIKQIFGVIDEIYGKYKIYITGPTMAIDPKGYIYFSQLATYKIYKYNLEGKLVKVFGYKGNFKEFAEDLSSNLSWNDIIKITKKYSSTADLFVSNKGYLLHQYIETTDAFFESRSLLDRLNYLKVYTLDGRYIKSDILLKGVLLTTNENGDLLILENDEPGNRTIGVYELKIVYD